MTNARAGEIRQRVARSWRQRSAGDFSVNREPLRAATLTRISARLTRKRVAHVNIVARDADTRSFAWIARAASEEKITISASLRSGRVRAVTWRETSEYF